MSGKQTVSQESLKHWINVLKDNSGRRNRKERRAAAKALRVLKSKRFMDFEKE